MRMLISILIALILLIGTGIWTNGYLQTSSDKLGLQIEEICRDIEQESWDDAENKTRMLENTWQQSAKWWPVFLDHQEMDNIEFSLAKAKAFVESENKPLSLGQLSELKLMIEHLPIKEEINLKNIL
ncbi:MAG: DUF4363 family protein [Syntrophomonadaceae bacterium]|nr:DUF4363 family protein [Syntrophomonadaceae bacterium]